MENDVPFKGNARAIVFYQRMDNQSDYRFPTAHAENPLLNHFLTQLILIGLTLFDLLFDIK